MIMMNQLFVCVVSLVCASEAFVMNPAILGRRGAIQSIALRLAAVGGTQEHKNEFIQKWSELQQREKDIEDHPDDAAAYNLAKEMLELALNAVQTAEVDEINHVATAHEAFEKAASEEKSLEGVAREVHHEAEDADEILETYNHEHFQEDVEKRRELAVSDIAHHVENYVESRLRAAREAEEAAKEEESKAKKSLEQLLINEEELRATLDELKALRKETKEAQP